MKMVHTLGIRNMSPIKAHFPLCVYLQDMGCVVGLKENRKSSLEARGILCSTSKQRDVDKSYIFAKNNGENL